MPRSPEDQKRLDQMMSGSLGSKAASSTASDEPESSGGSVLEAPGDFARGAAQGGLNLVEGPAQWAEQGIRHIPGMSDFKMPLHDWAAGFRRRAESSPAGIAGEVVGSVAPFLIPGGQLGGLVNASRLAELAARVPGGVRAMGAASRLGDLARSTATGARSAAEALRPAQEIPNVMRGGQAAAQAESLSSRAGGLINRGVNAWNETDAPTRAFLKAGSAGTFLTPKDSDHFGREALEDFMVGGALGRLGNIGERIRPGGQSIADMYKHGDLAYRSTMKEGPRYKEPKTRAYEDLNPRQQGMRDRAFREYTRKHDRFRENLARKPGFKRDYPEEARLGAMDRYSDARRQWESAQRAYERRRNFPHSAAHLARHIPFLAQHGPLAVRYFLSHALSIMAREWARRSRFGGAAPAMRDPLRNRPFVEWLNRQSPSGLGMLGAQVRQQTGGVGPYVEAGEDMLTGSDDDQG